MNIIEIAQKVCDWIYRYETEPIDVNDITKGRRIFYVGTHEKPDCSLRMLAGVAHVIEENLKK